MVCLASPVLGGFHGLVLLLGVFVAGYVGCCYGACDTRSWFWCSELLWVGRLVWFLLLIWLGMVWMEMSVLCYGIFTGEVVGLEHH